MTPPSARLELDDLLSHSSWMASFARCLVQDSARAEDLVQQAWVAALEKPPTLVGRQRAWLRSVLRRLAARGHRTDGRRLARERAAASSEVVAPEELLERAEFQQQMARMVLDLDEPYRSTVLFHIFEGLSSRDTAVRMGVPEATMKTRFRRAVEKLREQLDREHGGREAWGALALPLALGDKAVPTLVASGTVAASAGIGALATTWTIGSLIMAKGFATVVVLAAVALSAGYWWGAASQPPAEKVAPTSSVTEEEHEKLRLEKAEVEARLAKLEAANTELGQQNTDLTAEVEKLTAPPVPVEVADLLPVSFGDFSKLEELQSADWARLAAAIIKIDDEVVKLEAALAAGESPDPQTQMRIMAENTKLQEYALSIIGKLPTHQSGNGEFSHPISVANMVSAYLDAGELPLEPAQRAEISALGEEYNTAFASLSDGYDDETYKLEILLDELDLKNDFVNRMYDTLDPSQESFVIKPSIRGRAALDTLSPSVMLMMKANPMSVDSREQLREKLVSNVASNLGVDQMQVTNSRAFDDWIADMDSILSPQPRYLHSMFKAEEASVAGRAQLRAIQRLADEFELSDEVRSQLQSLQFLLVPRMNPE